MSQADLNDLIAQLKAIVDIKSISSDGAANDRVQALIAPKLEAMGFQVTLITHEHHHGCLGTLLCAELPGEQDEFITLIAHSDTVNACDDFIGFHYKSDDEEAHGPGVIDCKGGVIIALEALRQYLSEHPKPKYAIRFVCSPAEETGSQHFHEHLHQYSLDTAIILGFEPSFTNGNVVNARAGNRWYRITAKGRSAHSGRYFTKGINAVSVMAEIIIRINTLTDVNKGTTVAVTHILGGNENYNTIRVCARLMLIHVFI